MKLSTKSEFENTITYLKKCLDDLREVLPEVKETLELCMESEDILLNSYSIRCLIERLINAWPPYEG
ncbi:hypothetical protein LCGC14_0739500 [marine sediment metagenome]|uniref:Uncharacterized protein n=1 Tax=marine sediment metagenome TaxID=412755 RepID=A0A0F9TEF9_9ZZZZ